MSYKFIQAKKARLLSPVSSTATSLLLADFEDIYGNGLTMADFGTIGFLTIEPRSRDKQEIVSFTAVTDNGDGTWTITIGTRGLKAVSPYTTGGTATSHGSGKEVVVSNNPQLYNKLAVKENDEAVTGYWTFPDPVSNQNPVTKAFLLSMLTGYGTLKVDAVVVIGTAGETIASGDKIYLKMSDQRWYKTDADTTATFDSVLLGIAQGAGTAGVAISGGVLLWGSDTAGTYTAGSNYYLSNTAGGAVPTADQTNVVFIGFAYDTNKLFFDPKYTTLPTYTEKLAFATTEEKQAMAGTQGAPSTSNKYVTSDNTSIAGSDQSQTTQNATVEVTEASATGRKNKVAQSFVAGKTKVRGIELYKVADTGTFTGTVTISIQADTTGSPSGSALVSKTITNARWLVLRSSNLFQALFATEYSSLVIGTTYWIVVEGSTADNTNHINIGSNSAGGYGSGSVKYYNATDGWVAIATIDLYFKVLEGVVSQVIKSDSNGRIPKKYGEFQQMQLGITQYQGADWLVMRREFHGGFTPNNTTTNVALWSNSSHCFKEYAHGSTSSDYINLTGVTAHANASLLYGFITNTSADAQFSDITTALTKMILEWTVIITDLTDGEFFMGFCETSVLSNAVEYNVGGASRNVVGVLFRSNGNIYLQSSQNTNVTATLATGGNLPKIPFGAGRAVCVRIEFDAGSQARLYIDGDLVASHSTNLANPGGGLNIGYTFNEITAGTLRYTMFPPTLAVRITP